MVRKRLIAGILSASLAATIMSLGVPPSGASESEVLQRRAENDQRIFKSLSNQKCLTLKGLPHSPVVQITTSGSFSFFRDEIEYPNIDPDTVRFDDWKISDPTVNLVFKKSCSASADTKVMGKAKIHQGWYHRECGINGGAISVAFPWSVAVAGNLFYCNDVREPSNTTTYSANSAFYTQSNSGNPARWDRPIYVDGFFNLIDNSYCVGGLIKVTAWNKERTVSDTVVWGNNEGGLSSGGVCSGN